MGHDEPIHHVDVDFVVFVDIVFAFFDSLHQGLSFLFSLIVRVETGFLKAELDHALGDENLADEIELFSRNDGGFVVLVERD